MEKIYDNLDFIDNKTKDRIDILIEIFKYVLECKKSIFKIEEMISLSKKINKNDSELLDVIIEISHILRCNKNFSSIKDYSSLDFYDKPFVLNYDFPDVYILFLEPAFFSIGFYNCMMGMVRKSHIDIDSKMGSIIERIVFYELKALGLDFLDMNKKYTPSKKQGTLETDIIFEFDDKVVFMEIKKKVLTKLARGGDYLSILDDLAKSLIQSQAQAHRHERHLLEKGCIEFDDNSILYLSNRDIIKVSLSHFNYGSLHDFTFTSTLLDILGRGFLSDPDPNNKFKVDTFNKSLKLLHKEIHSLSM